MKIISLLHPVFITALLFSATVHGSSYNQIKIDEIDTRGNVTRVMISIADIGQSSPEVVILIKNRQGKGFFLPEVNGRLVIPQRVSPSSWRVEFNNTTGSSEIYAVSCVPADSSSRSGWSVEKDYQSLKYLDFHEHTSIEQSMYVLDNFGWRPTGYTFTNINVHQPQ